MKDHRKPVGDQNAVIIEVGTLFAGALRLPARHIIIKVYLEGLAAATRPIVALKSGRSFGAASVGWVCSADRDSDAHRLAVLRGFTGN